MKIGEEIKRLRIKRGLTQKQLGEMCGMADSAIRKYESGKVKPKIEAIKNCKSAGTAFGGSNPPSPTKARKSLENRGFSGFSSPLFPLFRWTKMDRKRQKKTPF